jgi:hypothetical protein
MCVLGTSMQQAVVVRTLRPCIEHKHGTDFALVPGLTCEERGGEGSCALSQLEKNPGAVFPKWIQRSVPCSWNGMQCESTKRPYNDMSLHVAEHAPGNMADGCRIQAYMRLYSPSSKCWQRSVPAACTCLVRLGSWERRVSGAECVRICDMYLAHTNDLVFTRSFRVHTSTLSLTWLGGSSVRIQLTRTGPRTRTRTHTIPISYKAHYAPTQPYRHTACAAHMHPARTARITHAPRCTYAAASPTSHLHSSPLASGITGSPELKHGRTIAS